MITPRFKGLEAASTRDLSKRKQERPSSGKLFGSYVFSRDIMRKLLKKPVYENVCEAMEGHARIKPEYADEIAEAMKKWAISMGATHYTHWFQPLTGSTAEKHDAFIDWAAPGEMIEHFAGGELLQGEPDASSFPSGGLRSTYEARGYTGWDPTSPAFIWKAGDGVTLCIPSVFFSWTGNVLDNKIPLLRSDKLINDASLRLLKLCGTKAKQVYSTLGWEQEYFIIDRALRNLRPDLVVLGRTVYGAPSPKGQELQDHYFGVVQDRVLSYMDAFEEEALRLGIPVKTRHNEVAPAQHEVAPVYEKSSIAVDHNILIMELMRRTAVKHELACLMDEKPFAGLNGSGKHNNWSLATDTGLNLLDPGQIPENPIQFLILLAAILTGVHENADLLLASVASAGNDNRLGGHEAPPAIVSVYLGEALERYVEGIEKGAQRDLPGKEIYDLGIPHLPDLKRDDTDRNRTSPFAFTGQKFEYRAVGSASSCAMPVTILNIAVARALNTILDEIETVLPPKGALSKKRLAETAMPIIRKYFKRSKKIRFAGDNYDEWWHSEAAKRKLPRIHNAPQGFEALISKRTVKAFEGILSKEELESRYEIAMENYALTKNIEINLILEMFRTQVLPAALHYQKDLSKSISSLISTSKKSSPKAQLLLLEKLSKTIDTAINKTDELEKFRDKAEKLPTAERAHAHASKVWPKARKVRELIDGLETMVDDKLWPFPKYRELLFLK